MERCVIYFKLQLAPKRQCCAISSRSMNVATSQIALVAPAFLPPDGPRGDTRRGGSVVQGHGGHWPSPHAAGMGALKLVGEVLPAGRALVAFRGQVQTPKGI